MDIIKARDACVKNWQENEAAERARDVSISPDDCEFCKLYFFTWDVSNKCVGCPVMAKTGKIKCFDSPYDAASQAYENWCDGSGTREEFQECAAAEVEFLKELNLETE